MNKMKIRQPLSGTRSFPTSRIKTRNMTEMRSRQPLSGTRSSPTRATLGALSQIHEQDENKAAPFGYEIISNKQDQNQKHDGDEVKAAPFGYEIITNTSNFRGSKSNS